MAGIAEPPTARAGIVQRIRWRLRATFVPRPSGGGSRVGRYRGYSSRVFGGMSPFFMLASGNTHMATTANTASPITNP